MEIGNRQRKQSALPVNMKGKVEKMSEELSPNEILTPESIERRLNILAKEINDAHFSLSDAEFGFQKTTSQYEVAMARSRVEYASKTNNGKNYTVVEREDMALLDNMDAYFAKSVAEAIVKSARANAKRLEIQVDIVRSQGTSVRSALSVN